MPSTTRIPHRILATFVVLAAAELGTHRLFADEAAPARPRILVPAYFYPSGEGRSDWDSLIAASRRTPIVAIVNPASGPGKQVDPNYADVLRKAKESPLVLIGYVSTRYGKRPIHEIRADIETWERLYPGLQGYFFDEQSSDDAMVEHYAAISAFVRKRTDRSLIVANPGVICSEGYFRASTADAWCVFEAKGPIDAYKPPTWFAKYPADRFALLGYGNTAAQAENAARTAATKRAGLFFVTDDDLPNPWDRLPPYWNKLVASTAGKK